MRSIFNSVCFIGIAAAFANVSPAFSAPLISQHFSGDAEAQAVANGQNHFTMPPDEWGMLNSWIGFRVINAYRILGAEKAGIPWGKPMNAAVITELDARVAAMEPVIQAQADLLPQFSSISGPNFLHTLKQSYAAHVYGSILELFNSAVKYQTHSNSCLLANLVPQMCGALVNFGVTDGSYNCATGPLRTQQIIQSPELFGFDSSRSEISSTKAPNFPVFQGTFAYAATLIHEFTHDLDSTFDYADSFIHRQNDRKTECGPQLMNFRRPNSPFQYNGSPGNQAIADYVSFYAAGLNNASQDYRHYEDAAESVTAYILLPEHFRKRMVGSSILEAKYNYIRDQLFGGKEFKNPHLDPGADYEVVTTISQFYTVNPVPTFLLTDIQLLQVGPGTQPQTVPGLVQMENFDAGLEGVTYHDTTPGNASGLYRDSGVDIAAVGTDGYAVTQIAHKEWLEYTIQVSTPGRYLIVPKIRNSTGGGLYRAQIDGVLVSDFIPIHTNFGTGRQAPYITMEPVTLTAGLHKFRIVFYNPTSRADPVTAFGDWDSITFTLLTDTGGRPAASSRSVQWRDVAELQSCGPTLLKKNHKIILETPAEIRKRDLAHQWLTPRILPRNK